MEENNTSLNQDQVTTEEDGFFDDFTDSDTATTPSANETSQETTQETTQEATPTTEEVDNQPFLTIRYDKEDVPLTREEAISFAQKGKNYDRLYERYDQLNGELSRLAQMNGMDVETYINNLNDTQYRYEVNKELHSLQERYPETSEEVLNELATERVNARLNTIAKEQQTQQQEQADAQTLEIRRQLQLFKEQYPNLEPDKLDTGVYDLVKKGYTLLEAYGIWARIESQKNKPNEDARAKIDNLNQANKTKSYGSMVNASDNTTDDFMQGWNDD